MISQPAMSTVASNVIYCEKLKSLIHDLLIKTCSMWNLQSFKLQIKLVKNYMSNKKRALIFPNKKTIIINGFLFITIHRQ